MASRKLDCQNWKIRQVSTIENGGFAILSMDGLDQVSPKRLRLMPNVASTWRLQITTPLPQNARFHCEQT